VEAGLEALPGRLSGRAAILNPALRALGATDGSTDARQGELAVSASNLFTSQYGQRDPFEQLPDRQLGASAHLVALEFTPAAAVLKSQDRVLTQRERRLARASTLHQLAAVGEAISVPPLPRDAIAYIATFLIHATLPYKDPGSVELWTRRSDKHSVTFESGWTPPDREGKQRKVGLPFGIYPRLIFSWLTTQAVLTGSPDLSLGPSFMSWIRDGLHVTPSGGPRGTITLIREQMTRILAMKITVATHQAVSHLGRSQMLSGSFSVLPVAGEAAFWDPVQPNRHTATDPHLRLSLDYFHLCKTAAAPFDERVQLELARRGACMAIDLYRLLTLKQFALQKGCRRAPELLGWSELASLLGHGNRRRSHLREAVANALQLVRALYPNCNAEVRHGGLLVRPGAPHIPPAVKRRSSFLLR
jgi:hypothetical protein